MTNRLRQYIEQETHAMLRTLRHYLYRAGVDGGDSSLDDAAHELWNEVVREALRYETRYSNELLPRPWLLGIAANLIRREQVSVAKRRRREPLVRDLYQDDDMSDDELFDRFADLSLMTDDIEQEEAVAALLKGVSREDQLILRLAIVHSLDGAALARELGISPGAARVRLHRALDRLRDTHAIKKEGSNGK